MSDDRAIALRGRRRFRKAKIFDSIEHNMFSLFSKHGLHYNHIIDGIYIGTNSCCQTHFSEILLAEKITADISVEAERIDSPYGVEYFLWIPIIDHTAPKQDQLDLVANALEGLVKAKKRVYVHCKNGHGRAPTMVAAYLIRKGYTAKAALDFIATKRPSIHPQPVQQKALQQFEKRQRTH